MEKTIEKLENLKDESLTKIINTPSKKRKVVGTFCTFAPVEVIHSSGAIPVSLCSMDDATIAASERHLPSDLCPLIKSSYGYALEDKCPYFHYSNLIVGETTCDGKKKMYEYLNKIKQTHVMQLPYDLENDQSLKFWKYSVLSLIDKLEKNYNTVITEGSLNESIRLFNRKRKIYRKIYSIMKSNILPCSGKDIYKILSLSNYIFDIEKIVNLLEEIYENIKSNDRNLKGPRILLTGCPIGKATEKIIDAIESNGGIVVFYENCTISKENHELIDEEKNPIDAITEHYLNIPCSCMSPNKGRFNRLEEAINEYSVDGIIDMRLKFCHTYNIEGYSIEKYVEDKLGKSYLGIETDYSQKDSGQLNTRIEAFLEML